MLAKIGEILTENKLITQEQLDHCLAYKKMRPGLHLGSILKQHGFITDHQLADCLSIQIDWKKFRGEYVPGYLAIEKVGLEYFCEHQVFPLKNGEIPSFVVPFIDDVEITDFLKDSFGHAGINFI